MKRINFKEEDKILQKYSHILVGKLNEIKLTNSIERTCIERFHGGISAKKFKNLANRKDRLYPKHFYLFADRGVFTLHDLIGEKALSDMPKKEQIVLKKMFLKSETAELIHFLEEHGVDVLEILRAHSKAIYSRKLK